MFMYLGIGFLLRNSRRKKKEGIQYRTQFRCMFSPTFSTAPLHIVYPTAAGIAPLEQSALYERRAD